MGTTLTGTTPQDTYDSLIKVTDNGPLSGTAKYLSDGLGNDSKLALATSGVGIGTTSPVTVFTAQDTNANVAVVNVVGTSPNYIFDVRDDGTSVFRVAGTGNVGIGTSTPAYKLEIFDGGGSSLAVGASTGKAFLYADNNGATLGAISAIPLRFNINGSEVGRFLAGGGLTFNGDTAAANALDDYEEGTWTMGVSFGGASVGVTYSNNTGTYTKIGRQVTVNGYILLSSKGSSTGEARITGLPFTIPNSIPNYSAANLYGNRITFANQLQGNGEINSTTIELWEITEAGVVTSLTDSDFVNNTGFILSFTYFV